MGLRPACAGTQTGTPQRMKIRSVRISVYEPDSTLICRTLCCRSSLGKEENYYARSFIGLYPTKSR